MLTIQAMVKRLIELREAGIFLTLLAVCPNSEAVLEAAVQAAARNHTPMLLAATLNQIDRDGGYTGWTPHEFVAKLKLYAQKYECRPALFPCLDHGGPWLKDAHTRDKLSFEETNAAVKTSISAMLEAGYSLLHIDPTIDRTRSEPLPLNVTVQRSLDLIEHAEKERQRLHLPSISYEVGTEEVHGGLVDLANFKRFLAELREGLAARQLGDVWPAFVVAQVGTDLQTTTFDRQAAATLYQMAAPYGSLVKGHYTDWVDNAEDYPLTGMGGANVGPEFTSVEYEALVALEKRERALVHVHPELPLSEFNQVLAAAVDASNRWQKWLQLPEKGKKLDELLPLRRDWLVKTGARYVWSNKEVVVARQQLYDNLSPYMSDPHAYVVEQVTRSIEHYIVAFNLFGAWDYWA